MGKGHARLGPSGASRWLECPGSVLLVESLPRVGGSSVYADEGTAAHDLGELKARLHFGKITGKVYSRLREEWLQKWDRFTSEPEWVAEVDRHIDGYVELIQEEMDREPGSVLLLEERVDAGVPESWGTSDAVIIGPTTITAIDLKYGAGVKVYAPKNPQLRLYGAGALREFGDLLDTIVLVRCIVFQPRMDHTDVEEISADDLRGWIASVAIPAAEEALSPGARFSPGDSTCRWCDASGRCPAQSAAVFDKPFEEPGLMTAEEIAAALGRVDLVKRWLADVEIAALKMGYEEETEIPGYKVVMSGGVRKIVDPDGAREALHAVGFPDEKIMNTPEPKIKGIGDLEKLLGKDDFAAVVAPFVQKGEGRPSLAPIDDDRPAINRNVDAASTFGEYEGD